MVDETKKDEETKDEEKKVGLFAGLTGKKKKVEETDNMVEELVTAKMVETDVFKEEVVTADKAPALPKTISKTLKKTDEPVYRKDDKFRLVNRPGGTRKYFSGRQK